jgi:hypothetical protein
LYFVAVQFVQSFSPHHILFVNAESTAVPVNLPRPLSKGKPSAFRWTGEAEATALADSRRYSQGRNHAAFQSGERI